MAKPPASRRVESGMIRYTIRDLFWLTVVVAFAVLWCGEMRQRKLDGVDLWEKNSQLSADFNSAMQKLQKYETQDEASSGNNTDSRVAESPSPENKLRKVKFFVRRLPRYL